MTGAARSFCVTAALVGLAGGAGTAQAEPPATTAATSPPLEVAADTQCPRGDVLGRELGEILGLSATEHLSEVARLAYADGGLVVTLRDTEGRVLGARTLPLEGDCDELARAAAVVLATWLSDVHPEFVPRLAQRANATPSAPTVANAAGTTDGATRTSAANGSNAGKAVARVTRPSGSMRSSGSVHLEREWRLRAGAAVGAAVLSAPVAFAGTLSVAFVPNHGGIGATLRASAVTPRERDVPGGKVRYFRWPLAAGATLRFKAPSVALELDGGGALGWLHVAGRSFSPDHSADDATFGTFAAARALGTGGPIQPFAELAALFWLRSARVYADATQPSVALPRGELTLSAGVAFVR